jgi:hypothetical protein
VSSSTISSRASESGEVNVPLHDGRLSGVIQIAGTLGQVIAGRVPARPAPGAEDMVTVFDSNRPGGARRSPGPRPPRRKRWAWGLGQDVNLVD